MDTDQDKFEYLRSCGLDLKNVTRFIIRYDQGKVMSELTFNKYSSDEQLMEVIKLLKLDVEKFYMLFLFLYDYTKDVCFNGIEVEEGGHEMMWMLIERGRKLIAHEEPEPLKTDASCSFKIQGHTYKVNDLDSIAILLYWIHCSMIKMSPSDNIWKLNWLIDDFDTHKSDRNESVSVAIWCFASLMMQFFKNNPQFTGRAPKGSGISLNKLLLTSKLIYLLDLSRNESFLYSDETLKGFMRQYKNRPLPSKGKTYG